MLLCPPILMIVKASTSSRLSLLNMVCLLNVARSPRATSGGVPAPLHATTPDWACYEKARSRRQAGSMCARLDIVRAFYGRLRRLNCMADDCMAIEQGIIKGIRDNDNRDCDAQHHRCATYRKNRQ